ncbi:hypothetical protein N7539_008306 [Penicillium diatomitis]|uniref:Uncharacterized protein n=1 Tax=Penicillium diatomitis TaxID=2819901 RepID=A0A9X0BN26_9EURO|nr:uncharacterized protein N7539_008306 [Penicillium diatomitis]KAJ5475240.1 hypothetical protein N7539_008306 [Penicillium diatomitis]
MAHVCYEGGDGVSAFGGSVDIIALLGRSFKAYLGEPGRVEVTFFGQKQYLKLARRNHGSKPDEAWLAYHNPNNRRRCTHEDSNR